MEQDGKVDQATQARRTADLSTGKIVLTLCMASTDASGYRHVVIPFPPSYEAACAEALRAFTAYIPADVETVSLRQAVQRRSGETVWSIILEDSWNAVLEKSGEEIGVFLPYVLPESVPYQQPPKKLVRFHFNDLGRMVQMIRAVGSLQDCGTFRDDMCERMGWTGLTLSYDERMMGTEVEQQFYRSNVQNSSSKPNWRVFSKTDAEIFNLLLNMHPEPMAIYMSNNQYVV